MKTDIWDIPSNSSWVVRRETCCVCFKYLFHSAFITGSLYAQPWCSCYCWGGSLSVLVTALLLERKHRALSYVAAALCLLHLSDSHYYSLLCLVIFHMSCRHNTSPLVCELPRNKSCDLLRCVLHLQMLVNCSNEGWSTGEKIRLSTLGQRRCLCSFCSLLYPQGLVWCLEPNTHSANMRLNEFK